MSRKDLLKISLVLTLVACAGTAYASNSVITGTISVGTSSFSPSANVTVSATATDTAYTAIAGHLNGNRTYLGTNSDPKLYFATKDPGTVVTTVPTSIDTTTWSSL